jgi:epoxyqueuosine reductase
VSLTQVIKNETRRLGFTQAGVTTPDTPPHVPTYENWLALGRNGSMDYLADERALQRRRDPRLVLPECRSILVLAVRYPDPSTDTSGQAPETATADEGTGPTGRVAAYAWGQDYHLVLTKRLKSLAGFTEEQAGGPVPHRYYTDTGPLLERELAQRAGLGWIGKNTCLINPRLGSYFLLAEILLGIELEPDEPFTFDRCGTCTRCIDACPTGCIQPDRTLDARRCISYLTIENRGNIQPDLRPLMGKWIFGCDVCQMVCPWNRFAAKDYDQAFAPRPALPNPDLKTELMLTPQEFARRFKNSPIQRTRRTGYLRNIAVALGNSGDPLAVPALERALQIEDPLVREYSVWAMEQIRKD